MFQEKVNFLPLEHNHIIAVLDHKVGNAFQENAKSFLAKHYCSLKPDMRKVIEAAKQAITCCKNRLAGSADTIIQSGQGPLVTISDAHSAVRSLDPHSEYGTKFSGQTLAIKRMLVALALLVKAHPQRPIPLQVVWDIVRENLQHSETVEPAEYEPDNLHICLEIAHEASLLTLQNASGNKLKEIPKPSGFQRYPSDVYAVLGEDQARAIEAEAEIHGQGKRLFSWLYQHAVSHYNQMMNGKRKSGN